MTKTNLSIFITMCILFSQIHIQADEAVYLQYNQIEGQVLHADSLVDETIYINGFLSHQAEIDEFSVTSVRQSAGEKGAILDSSFRTVERIGVFSGLYDWISSETVRFSRDHLGNMDVPESAARPVLRNVPRFPNYAVKPGDSWSLPGEEVHVLRINGLLYGPYRGAVQVLYNYINNEIKDGRTFARIALEYSVYLPVRQSGEPIRLLSGQSRQEILWDIEEGKPDLKTEDFEFMMMMSNGNTQEFVGRGRTTYRLTESLNRSETVESLMSELQAVPGVTVESTEEGILLSVIETDRILFEPESSIVSESQRFRLEQLSESLGVYGERDILITGHTASYGTLEGRKQLSRDRAESVADILFPNGRSGTGRFFLRGAGNTEPLGTDGENRRVEILILD